MPANKLPKDLRRTKCFGQIVPAGSNTAETSVRVVPGNPERTMLVIQNTGANAGLVRFEEPVQGDGGDILFEAGSGLVWDRAATCPEAAINVGSLLGTTFSITEQVTPS